MSEYRVHVTVRRKGEPVFTSIEYKSENCDGLEEICYEMSEFVTQTIEDDQDYQELKKEG